MKRTILIALLLLICRVAFADDDLRLWYDHPAAKWDEALPLGNGRMGAMVFGGVTDERIQFNEDTLWTGKPHDYVRAGAADSLKKIQQLIFDGKSEDAVKLTRATFLSDPVRQKAYQPFGDVWFHFPNTENVDHYRCDLDLNTGIATISYRVGDMEFKRETFASYPDNVIVMRISASKPGQVNFAVKMDSPHKNSKPRAMDASTLVLDGKVQDDGLSFESRLHLLNTGGTVKTGDDQTTVENADSVVLILAASTSFKNFQDITADPAERCATTLEKLGGKKYEAILADHIADHRGLFDRVKLTLGNGGQSDLPTDRRLNMVRRAVSGGRELAKDEPSPTTLPAAGLESDPSFAALYFQWGRYMLIASSRPGGQPANLQGIWNDQLAPPWESKFTTNINLEMNYWPAETANLSDCATPLFDMIDDLVISGGRTANEQYHARGWVLHHNTDEWRGTAPINNIDGVWPTGGAWLCQHLWEHYLFTGDKDFLAKRAYPAMKGASLFFVDYLVADPHTGFLVTNPSFSPEQGSLCAGPSMDMQMIRAVMDHTIAAAGILNTDADFVKQLTDVRGKLAPDKIGQHGQLQEWQEDVDAPNNNHRHMSPLWGLYPGAEFTRNEPKLFDAAKLLLGWRGDGSTGWSYAWRVALQARVHAGDAAFRQLNLQLARRTLPNLFDLCGPFQVDGDFGSCAGVAEMLLQSHVTVPNEPNVFQIELLPAIPRSWATGSVSGLKARGGFEVDMTWKDGKLTAAAVRSTLGNPCRVSYGDRTIDLKTSAGKSYSFDGQLAVAK